uniref:Family with sequence similarity 72 member B n=1 Tax=Cyclopterus lumpus TaxID=8103 RepID=A0A8C2XBS8_CYCLU
MSTSNANFKNKCVTQVNCTFCDSLLCTRGMKAVLLADTEVELCYSTESCKCKLRDIACLKWYCNVVGYHVVAPCKPCQDEPLLITLDLFAILLYLPELDDSENEESENPSEEECIR